MKADVSDAEIKKICEIIGYPDKSDNWPFALMIEAMFHLSAGNYKSFRKFVYKALALTRERK